MLLDTTRRGLMWDVKVVDMRCKWCSFAFIAYYLYIAYIAIAYYLYIQPTQNIPFANCYTLHISVPVKTTNLELMLYNQISLLQLGFDKSVMISFGPCFIIFSGIEAIFNLLIWIIVESCLPILDVCHLCSTLKRMSVFTQTNVKWHGCSLLLREEVIWRNDECIWV